MRARKDDENLLHIWHQTQENMYLSVNYVVFTILIYQCLTLCVGKKNDTEQGKSLFV